MIRDCGTALVVGLMVGAMFALARTAPPAPAAWAGVLGIVGIVAGFQAVGVVLR